MIRAFIIALLGLTSITLAESVDILNIDAATVDVQQIGNIDQTVTINIDASADLDWSLIEKLPAAEEMTILGDGKDLNAELRRLLEKAQGVRQIAFEEVALADLGFLAGWSHLEVLKLNSSSLADAGAISGLGQLREISLHGSQLMPSEGFEFPPGLSTLTIDRSIYLSGELDAALKKFLGAELAADGSRVLTITGDI